MKKKLISVALVSAMLIGCLSACGSSSGQGDNGKLYVYNWGEYIDEDVIEQFEEETGIDVVYDMFETNEIMFAKLAQDTSAYDVICPSDYMIQKLIEKVMIQPLNFTNIPNAKNIGDEYFKNSEVFDPGNRYSVPYC